MSVGVATAQQAPKLHRSTKRMGGPWKRRKTPWKTRRWVETTALIAMMYVWWKIWTLDPNQPGTSTSSTTMMDETIHGLEREEEKVAFVFTVHGAIPYFTGALETLMQHTAPKPGQRFKVFVADDCEVEEESTALEGTLKIVTWEWKVISMGMKRVGYTKSVNAGLKAAWGENFDILVTINSDVVFTPNWLEPLIAALKSSHDIGMSGPIGNAASYQSVPELYSTGGTWHKNPLPEGLIANDMSKLAFLVSKCNLISVPILNGFLMAIHRRALQEIGWMNEDLFPFGYGEENEFAFRLKAAGFRLVVNPMSYIYHHKTKSFSNRERMVLAKEAKQVIAEHMGAELANAERDLQSCEALSVLREEFADHLKSMHQHSKTRFSVLFILNPMPKSLRFLMRGGWISVVQEALGLIHAGAQARVAVQAWTKPAFEENFPEASKHGVFLGYQSTHTDQVAMELLQLRVAFDFLVATHHTTVPLVLKMGGIYPNSVKGYYVQDIEENFRYNRGTQAASTFSSLKDGFVFAKTRFLVHQLKNNYNVSAHLIPPTLDLALFSKGDAELQHVNTKEGVMHICAMVRTLTPRRNPLQTLEILSAVQKDLGSGKIQVSIFGSSTQEIQSLLRRKGKSVGLLQDITVLGPIDRQQVADLFDTCTFFLDFSAWQAFGRSGLEAMAMGCIPILPITGGGETYAEDGANALLVNTTRIENGIAAIKDLISGKYNLQKMRTSALLSSKKYNISESGQVTADIFQNFHEQWTATRHYECTTEVSIC